MKGLRKANCKVAGKLIDLLPILQKSLDRELFIYNFIREVRSSCVRAFITIVLIRKFYKIDLLVILKKNLDRTIFHYIL